MNTRDEIDDDEDEDGIQPTLPAPTAKQPGAFHQPFKDLDKLLAECSRMNQAGEPFIAVVNGDKMEIIT